jgi:hypothetical protein
VENPPLQKKQYNTAHMFSNMGRHWPLWVALAALWVTMGVLQYQASVRTQGHLIYAIDDAYIHMSMAKNLAHHGVYGLTKYEFSSSSSSPLWTLVLALFYVLFGVHESTPFILELVIASLVLTAVYSLLRGVVRKKILLTVILLSIAFLTPLPVLIAIGMEHTLHILLSILFLPFAARSLVDVTTGQRGLNLAIMLFLCVGLVLTRYESYALVLVICAMFAIRRNWMVASALALSAVLPLFVYQAVSVANGWSWLPNSVLIRAGIMHPGIASTMEPTIGDPLTSQHAQQFWLTGWRALLDAPHLGVLIGASCVLLAISWIRSKQFWKQEHVVMVAFIIAALAHLQFGKVGHFYRYDAYLVALGIFVLAFSSIGLFDALRGWMMVGRQRLVGGAVGILFALQLSIPLMTRSVLAIPLVPTASQNIYQQQYQMGLFLQKYYSGKTIAANDIGAICYLADIHLVDLVGLASEDIRRLSEANMFNASEVLNLCRQKQVAVVVAYAMWLDYEGLSRLRQDWKLVGEWKINDDVVCGSNVVSFYAAQPALALPLAQEMRAFSITLPPGVDYRVRSDVALGASGTR